MATSFGKRGAGFATLLLTSLHFDKLEKPTAAKVAGAAALIAFGWFIEGGITAAWDYVKPERYKSAVERASEDILERTGSIETILSSLQADLASLESGDTAAADEVARQARLMIAEINALRPDLDRVADANTNLLSAIQREKAGALQGGGVSLLNDFELSINQGANLCPQKFNFGIAGLSNLGNPNAFITYRDQKRNTHLATGDAIFLEADGHGVSVSYAGPTGASGGQQKHGFNFSCYDVPS